MARERVQFLPASNFPDVNGIVAPSRRRQQFAVGGQRDALHLAAVVAKRTEQLAGHTLPYTELAIPTGGSKRLAVASKGQLYRVVRFPGCCDLLAGRRVVQTYHAAVIGARDCQESAIGRKQAAVIAGVFNFVAGRLLPGCCSANAGAQGVSVSPFDSDRDD